MVEKSVCREAADYCVEHDLLLLCSRASLSEENLVHIQTLLSKRVDWTYFSKLTFYHKVTHFVYNHLKTLQSSKVPVPVMQEFKSFVSSNNLRNMVLSKTLIEVVSYLENHQIRVVPFKGPILSHLLFHDISVRTSVDIDLLVHRKDIIPTISLLTGVGYKAQFDLLEREYGIVFRVENQVALVNEQNGVCVELHWKLNDRSFRTPYDFSMVKDRLTQIPLAGYSFNSLSNADLLVYLCIHGSHHCWRQLDLVCCVAGLLKKMEENDWPTVDLLADQLGCRRILFTGLLLADNLQGAHLPEPIGGGIREHKRVAEQVESCTINLLPSKAELSEKKEYGRSFFYHFKNHDRIVDKILFVIKLVFCPSYSDLEQVRFPGSLSFLYYIYRPPSLWAQFLRSRNSRLNKKVDIYLDLHWILSKYVISVNPVDSFQLILH